MQLMLPDLINDIAALPQPAILMLDDYHVISAPAIHESVAYLLGHLPPSLHVVLATRVDPPLPMARMRANQRLVDVRAADLRFTLEEAALFLNQCMRLDLAPDDIEKLLVRTEGWVVGLQLAALAIQSSASPKADQAGARATIEGFSGDHHYVLEYLVEQVLSHQPEHVQQFLYQTSILDRLCGPLCDAVLSGGDGEKRRGGEEVRR
jgi:LuxR family maltose regulon positive regulatory protein